MVNWLTAMLTGGIIGCFTNYLAIKMLFRPYSEKRILGIRIPFTPGIIPKRKNEIAAAIASIVCKDLLDEESFTGALCNERLTDQLVESVMRISVDTKGESGMMQKKAGEFVSEIIAQGDIKGMIAKECLLFLKDKLSGSIVSKFISNDILNEISDTVGTLVENYFNTGGKALIGEKISDEAASLSGMTVREILEKYGINSVSAGFKVKDFYTGYVKENIGELLQAADLAGLIQNKIETMQMAELEKMVFSVMRKELNAIVYLGAVIGMLIGILNIFV